MKTIQRAVAFVVLATLCALAQAQPFNLTPRSGGSSTITSGTTATSGCTAGGVLHSSSDTVVCADTDLTFNGTTLTATGLTVTNAPTFSALTSGRVPFAGTAGLIGDNANLVYAAANSRLRIGHTAAGTTMGWILGSDDSSSISRIWASTVTPSSTNYAFATDSTYTWINAAAGAEVQLRVNNTEQIRVSSTSLQVGSKPVIGFTAPTIASGGCTSPTVTNTNGTAYITIDVGTGCSGSQPVTFTLPAATTGWNCYARNITNGATSAPAQTGAVSTTSVTITNFARTTGVAAAWTDGDDVVLSCFGG